MKLRWKDSHSGPLSMETGLGLGFGLGETVDRVANNSNSYICKATIIQQTQRR